MSKTAWGYLYETKNLVNGKMYVGIRKCKKPGQVDPKYFGSGYRIKLALQKYGKENFIVRALAFAESSEQLETWEKKAIAWYRQKYGEDQIYNIEPGGYYWEAGHEYSEEIRGRMSVARRKRVTTPETRAKLSASMKGKNLGRKASPETILKLSLSHLGKKPSEETKKKRGESLKGHVVTELTRFKIKLGHIFADHSKTGKFKRTPEMNAKISATLMGHPVSKETIEKCKATKKKNGKKHSPEDNAKKSERLLKYYSTHKVSPETAAKIWVGRRREAAKRASLQAPNSKNIHPECSANFLGLELGPSQQASSLPSIPA